MSTESLPASLLRQWAYCPRIPFIREVMGAAGVAPSWVSQGMDYDAIQHALSRDRRLVGMGLADYRRHRRLSLRSERLGIHGIADLVFEGERDVIVADYKLDGARFSRGSRLQLGAYALMAAEHFGLPPVAVLLLRGKPVQATVEGFDDAAGRQVIAAIAALRHVLEVGRMPASDAGPGKCGICEHLNFCNDRE